MNRFLRTLSAGIAALCLLAAPITITQAFAAVALVAGDSSFPNAAKIIAYGDVTAGSTFATTSYADVAGSSITYTPTVNDCTTAARLAACLIEVDWSIDASKATATTGTCGVYVNAALVASSARTTSTTSIDTIGGSFLFANSVVGAQTVKLQCKSADTNVLTLTNGHMIVREVILPSRH